MGARGGTPQAITLQPRLCVQACVGRVLKLKMPRKRKAHNMDTARAHDSTRGHAVQPASKENMRGRRSQGAETQPPRVDLLGGAEALQEPSVFCDFLSAPQVNHFRRLLESHQSDHPNRIANRKL